MNWLDACLSADRVLLLAIKHPDSYRNNKQKLIKT